MSMRKTMGFTLIELMVVVAIIAILATLAFSNYSRYGFRTRRTEGQQFLVNIAAAEERYFTVYNQYTSNLTGSAPTGLGFKSSTSNSGKGYYTVAVTGLGASNTTYTLTATPQGTQGSDKCGSLTLDNIGSKTFTGDASNGSCW